MIQYSARSSRPEDKQRHLLNDSWGMCKPKGNVTMPFFHIDKKVDCEIVLPQIVGPHQHACIDAWY
jgi:hypothetical protein